LRIGNGDKGTKTKFEVEAGDRGGGKRREWKMHPKVK
jgi:hypothetical protein